ncbi:hypothetical protein LWP59_15955 [Amycolatopsis acidiphila]|uniref:Uncharacterized protein n=1 Tax=Amycolatopsis acidiphila TaxID=715473 RepID=A0A558A9F8_9PSEU|nr:hypothetical protein [Amycolatopsis acidiphila]TVT20895.1 hypothetical protein FNH06_18780 [Amycolatopsis acidiphila]UIJ63010.1 hypothetical protein LWP59_15955 [Amycolatopsis acidiphila]GHG65624.1 hypothetical protein GCM10017788_23230 [Amycolatopsis acidiphila]
MTCFGIDTGTPSLGEADQLAHDLGDRLRLPPQAVVCTHLVRNDDAHVALSVWVPPGFDGLWNELTRFAESGTAGVASGTGRSGRPGLAAAAADAAVEHLSRTGGRAVLYPGSAGLTGTVRIGELLARSAIARVNAVGGEPPSADDLLDTHDRLRPEWRAGELVLAVTSIHSGLFAPVETPAPTPCRADHA